MLANIYGSDCIVRIDPRSGLVTEWIVAAGLFPENSAPGVKVLNGIAYDHATHRLFVSASLPAAAAPALVCAGGHAF